jgi:hypothetical protein
MERYSVPIANVAGHRDYAATSCPGKNLYPKLQDGSFADSVKKLLG